jgi:hypothetical protein
MKKVAKYTILTEQDSYSLAQQVNEYISAGWQPYGDLQVTLIHSSLLRVDYTQAMVKYDKQEGGLP